MCVTLLIEKLCKKYNIIPLKNGIEKLFTKYSKYNDNLFICNNEYIYSIIDEFNKIKEILPKNIQCKFNKDIHKKILEEYFDDDDDIDDDIEDIMKSVNSLLNQCIMKSYTKVKKEHLYMLDDFLIKIGYKPIDVKEGYKINDYIKYFKEVFPEYTKDSNYKGNIKSIIVRPFKMDFYDENSSENIELILNGECIYYK
mgnify:CR=1 FL=1